MSDDNEKIQIATMSVKIENIEKQLTDLLKKLDKSYMVREEALRIFATKEDIKALDKVTDNNSKRIDKAYIVFTVLFTLVTVFGIPLGFYFLDKFFN